MKRQKKNSSSEVEYKAPKFKMQLIEEIKGSDETTSRKTVIKTEFKSPTIGTCTDTIVKHNFLGIKWTTVTIYC